MRRIFVALLAIYGLVAIGAAGPAIAGCHDDMASDAPALTLSIASPEAEILAFVAAETADRARIASPSELKRATCHTGSCCEAGCSHLAVSSVLDTDFNLESREGRGVEIFSTLIGFPPPLADRPPRS